MSPAPEEVRPKRKLGGEFGSRMHLAGGVQLGFERWEFERWEISLKSDRLESKELGR